MSTQERSEGTANPSSMPQTRDPLADIRARLRALVVAPVPSTMTQRAFARRAGVSNATISRFLQGKNVTVRDLFKVCAALGLRWRLTANGKGKRS